MSLIKCHECSAEISDEAKACPKCGVKPKKGVGVLGILGIAILALFGYSVFQSGSSSHSSADNPINTAQATINKQVVWEYSNSVVDEMSGKPTKRASLKSQNTHDLGFPYQGGTYGEIVVRQSPRFGNDIFFEINSGQLLCHSDDCHVIIKFDEDQPQRIAAKGSSDYRSTVLFLSGYKKLVTKIKHSKKVIIEAEFYKEGLRSFEFGVSGFPM